MKKNSLLYNGYGIAMLYSVLLFSSPPLWATTNNIGLFEQQNIVIKGTITDSEGPLHGVVIQIKGTKSTTLSDIDGNYSITTIKDDILIFSYVGYTTKEIQIKESNTNLNIVLEHNATEHEEILINTGYYTVKDRERTGSIARVTSKDIEHVPVTNPLQALQGRMAGVRITEYSGLPGGGFDIQIRGKNSLRTFVNGGIDGNKPLYIIDGVPISSESVASQGISAILSYNEINPLSAYNINDIESIEVLKVDIQTKFGQLVKQLY